MRNKKKMREGRRRCGWRWMSSGGGLKSGSKFPKIGPAFSNQGKNGTHTLSWLTELSVEGDGVIWRTRGEENTAVGPIQGVLEGELTLGGRVGKGEDDGGLVELGQAADNVLAKGAKGGGETNEGGGLDVLDNLGEGLELLAVVVAADKVLLMAGELAGNNVGTGGSDETLGVNEPEPLASLVLGEALHLEEGHHLLGDADGGGTATKEDNLVLLELLARGLGSTPCGGNEATENDRSGTV
jgi:hypothetical protein